MHRVQHVLGALPQEGVLDVEAAEALGDVGPGLHLHPAVQGVVGIDGLHGADDGSLPLRVIHDPHRPVHVPVGSRARCEGQQCSGCRRFRHDVLPAAPESGAMPENVPRAVLTLPTKRRTGLAVRLHALRARPVAGMVQPAAEDPDQGPARKRKREPGSGSRCELQWLSDDRYPTSNAVTSHFPSFSSIRTVAFPEWASAPIFISTFSSVTPFTAAPSRSVETFWKRTRRASDLWPARSSTMSLPATFIVTDWAALVRAASQAMSPSSPGRLVCVSPLRKVSAASTWGRASAGFAAAGSIAAGFASGAAGVASALAAGAAASAGFTSSARTAADTRTNIASSVVWVMCILPRGILAHGERGPDVRRGASSCGEGGDRRRRRQTCAGGVHRSILDVDLRAAGGGDAGGRPAADVQAGAARERAADAPVRAQLALRSAAALHVDVLDREIAAVQLGSAGEVEREPVGAAGEVDHRAARAVDAQPRRVHAAHVHDAAAAGGDLRVAAAVEGSAHFRPAAPAHRPQLRRLDGHLHPVLAGPARAGPEPDVELVAFDTQLHCLQHLVVGLDAHRPARPDLDGRVDAGGDLDGGELADRLLLGGGGDRGGKQRNPEKSDGRGGHGPLLCQRKWHGARDGFNPCAAVCWRLAAVSGETAREKGTPC